MNETSASYIRLDGGRIGLRRLALDDGPGALCFPHAGGQSLAFRGLAAHLAGRGAGPVYALDPPGHGWAVGAPLTSVTDLTAAYLEHLPREHLSGRIFIGHSMGGYVALDLALALQRRGLGPRAVIIGASRPPHRRGDYVTLTALSDEELFAELLRGDATVGAEQAALLDHFKGAIRADLRAFETYAPPELALACPLLVVGGLHDPLCRAEHLFEWTHYAGDCRVDFVPGGHLFAQSHAEAYAGRIEQFLRSCAAA